MITQLDLQHFKCFSPLKLPLRPLTLIAGTNASGKSSVLQSLAVLHQTMRDHKWSNRLMLNGRAVDLGTVADVVDQVEGDRSLEIGLRDANCECRWSFAGEPHDISMMAQSLWIGEHPVAVDVLHMLLPPTPKLDPNLYLPPTIDRKAVEKAVQQAKRYERDGVVHVIELARQLAKRMMELCYLTAERLGPRTQHPQEDLGVAPVVGPTGKHAVSVLHAIGDQSVLSSLALPGCPNSLKAQVEARMKSFFPGFELSMEPISGTNNIKLGVRTSAGTAFHRPGHTGFGLTQVLPIVVAALSATKNGLLLIENPGVHLHPKGQAAMGEFLADVSTAGVQVIMETHSDHVLNGVRRAVKAGKMPSTDVGLHFFRGRTEICASGDAQAESMEMDADGNIDAWPTGFFDQFDRDMTYLAGWA